MTTSTSVADLTGDYDLDPSHTAIAFVARHAMVTKVRGSFHRFQGHLHLDGENPTKSGGEVSIVADSIDTEVTDRDNHLRSNDFFDMPKYPKMTFESTGVSRVDDTYYKVSGDLTVKGVTKPVILDFEFTGAAVDPDGNVRVGLEGRTVVNRRDWGVNWNVALESGGVLVSDKVTIEIEVSAIRRKN